MFRKKLILSNKAHNRLVKKHKQKSNGENNHFIKMNYHSLVLHQQTKKNRLLTLDEKRIVTVK